MPKFGPHALMALLFFAGGCFDRGATLRGGNRQSDPSVTLDSSDTPPPSGPYATLSSTALTGQFRGFGTHFLPNLKTSDNVTYGGMTDLDYSRVDRLFKRIRFKFAHIMFPTQSLDPAFGPEQRNTVEWTLGLAEQHPSIQEVTINEPSHWYGSYADYAVPGTSEAIAQRLIELRSRFSKIHGLVLWQEPNGDGHVPTSLRSPTPDQDSVVASFSQAGALMRSALVQSQLASQITFFGPSAFYVYSSGFAFADQFNSLVSSRVGTVWDAQAWHYYSPYGDVSSGAFQTLLEGHLRRFNPTGRQVLDEFGCRPVANSGSAQVAELRSDRYGLCVWDALIQALLGGAREMIFWQFAEQYLWNSRTQLGNDDGFQSWAILRNKQFNLTPSPWGQLAIAAIDAIKPGATLHRVTMAGVTQTVRAVGAKNTDGTEAQLFFNPGTSPVTFAVVAASPARTYSRFSYVTESGAPLDSDGFLVPVQTGLVSAGVSVTVPAGGAAWVTFSP